MAGTGNMEQGTEATKVSAENQQRSKAKLKVTGAGRKDYENDYECVSSQSGWI